MNGRGEKFLSEALQDTCLTMRCAADALTAIRAVNGIVTEEVVDNALFAVAELMDRLCDEADGLLDEMGFLVRAEHGGGKTILCG